ncbi:SDR family oxidoreductase [Sphingomonas jatrophae]|uniref:NAD(P)-dependent dehydrogenase, short-chain alcohol dehydrogenase family n=1 Tax=Sphingomonas jatrophae TaxID=1166337 RepID=A0A1I6KI07_9SPHN|nr:SDR family oxidoreductase [Sphingomonas jatrophae]SFR90869.1 NAD(P)-dependent dehydrogenase, short-chain alcohol dehydrogenase family [Sphingomonas jatrophae]
MDGMDGKVAIVTGGTRGIGAAIVRRLLDAGCEVVTCGRQAPDALPEANGRQAGFVACDVRDPEQARSLVAQVVERHGRLDTLVNNAGGSPQAVAATASPRFSDAIVALNMMAPLHMAQAAYPHLKAVQGSIVNIASVAGVRPSPGTAVYGAAKAGLLSLTKSLAQEWGPDIRLNAIIVGLMETENTALTYGSEEAQGRIAASLPLRRMGRGGDIADAVAFLASPAASYISGAQLEVHGGGERPLFLEIVNAEMAAAGG